MKSILEVKIQPKSEIHSFISEPISLFRHSFVYNTRASAAYRVSVSDAAKSRCICVQSTAALAYIKHLLLAICRHGVDLWDSFGHRLHYIGLHNTPILGRKRPKFDFIRFLAIRNQHRVPNGEQFDPEENS